MLVRKGDWLEKDDNVLTLETGKVALDIPTPYAGFVEEVYVEVGQKVDQQQPLIRINDQLPP
jgi:pyruvate/2-oxoglutarate dehydrogenase complex dihydrolipoamide acyltransferase (E2) component